MSVGRARDDSAALGGIVNGYAPLDSGLKVPMAYAPFIGCIAQRTTDQTAVVTGTATVVSLTGTDVYDPLGMHDPSSNSSRIVIPGAYAGWWVCTAYVVWDLASATGIRQVRIYKDGAGLGLAQSAPGFSGGTNYEQITVTSHPTLMAANAYFEMYAFQTSGGNRTLSGSIVPLTLSAYMIGV